MKELFFMIIFGLSMTIMQPLYAEDAGGTLCGGWQIHTHLDADSLNVFQKGSAQIKEYHLEPISYATQVVAGMNYCFLCTAMPKNSGGLVSYAALNLYVNFHGKTEMTGFRLLPLQVE